MGTRVRRSLFIKPANIGEIWRGLNVGLKGLLGLGSAAVMEQGGGNHRDYAERGKNRARAGLGIASGLEVGRDFCVSVLGGEVLGGMGFVDISMIVSHGMESGLGGREFGGLVVGPIAACRAQVVPAHSEANQDEPGEKQARNQKSLHDGKGDRCLIAFVEYLAVARIDHVEHCVLVNVIG